MADAAPSSDTFIPVQAPPSDASGSSTSMTDTIRMALDQVKDAPANDEDDTPPAPKADKVKAEPVEVKDDKPVAKPEAKTDDTKADDNAPPKADVKDGEEKPGEAADDDKARALIKVPDRLLPDAKELWKNVPRSVQRDVDHIVREYEQQAETHRQQNERYESIRPFDELARSNGRDLRESLVKLNHIENQMQSNPIAGLNSILQEIGPRKADGSAITLFEVAQHIINQGPQGYHQAMAQASQQQQVQARDSEAQQLRQEVEALRAQQATSEIEARIIAPFRAQHPRYEELQGDIAFFLKSGRIPEGLSHLDRLEAAYAMAERLNPSPGSSSNQFGDPDRSDRVELDSSGRKSIRSSPGATSPDGEAADTSDVKALIRNNLRKAIRA